MTKPVATPITAEEAFAQADQSDGYVAYFWYLIAADFGDSEAASRLGAMESNDLVAVEDVRLAQFQLACWYGTGTHLERDDGVAFTHLRSALACETRKLDEKLVDAIAQVQRRMGLPETLDLDRPLGPAMPNTPGNVCEAQLGGTKASLLRATRWNARPTKPLGPTEDVCGIGFSPDKRWLLSGGVDGELLLWDSRSQQPIRRYESVGVSIDAIEFSPSGALVALGSESSLCIHVLDLENNELVALKGNGAVGARFLANGTQIIAGDTHGEIWIWDLATRKPIKKHAHGDAIWSMAVSADGRQLAVSDGGYQITLYTLPDFERVGALKHHRHLVHELSFDEEGRRLLSASRDHTVALWDIPTQTLVRVLAGHTGIVYAALFTSDGAISAGLDGLLLRWDLETGTHSKIDWPSKFVPAIATRFSRGFRSFYALALAGTMLVSGGENAVLFHDLC